MRIYYIIDIWNSAWTFKKDTLCSHNMKTIHCVKWLHAARMAAFEAIKMTKIRADRLVSFDDWQVSIAFWRFALKYVGAQRDERLAHFMEIHRRDRALSKRSSEETHYVEYYDWLSSVHSGIYVLTIPRWIAVNYEWKMSIIFAVYQSF